ncbi:hypothetical protein [Spelaeicoccus albus]|uniref:Deferrochelatase/peroxidase EfeB n=1 Tax=Spelaeicoccus albus TaxID=1280376 RepID=A0A7Z0A9X8_9MICO|nr:hypothetical protein [Spelaeicoccus albus]NYI66065.1 deferrochelatase/peroxidase EfeB [Spelaeicoccus albus]
MKSSDATLHDFHVSVTIETGHAQSRARLLNAFKKALTPDKFPQAFRVQINDGLEASDIDISFAIKAQSNPDAQRRVNELMSKLAPAMTAVSESGPATDEDYEEVGRGLRPLTAV